MKKITLAILILLTASFIWGANLISEGFATTSLPTGWSGDVYFNSTANHGTLTGANGAGFNLSLKYLQFPSVDTAGTLTFWTKGSATASAISYRVLKSVGGGAFSTIADYPQPHNTTWIQRTVNVNDASSNIVIKIEAYNRTGNSIYLDDVVLTDYSVGTPTVTVTGTLNAFSTVTGTASAFQSYKVSGANLTADISVTAPTNFELSKSSGGTYTTGLTFTQSGGAVAEQDVFVRIAASAAAGTYTNVNITHTSTGATQVDKAVSGTVYKTAPTNHATTFIVGTGTPSYSVIDAVWDDATGTVVPDGYLVKGSDVGYSSIADPVDGTAEANSTLVKNVAAGVEYASFTGLTEHTTYYFKIFPYTNSGTNIAYKTNDTVPTDSEITAYGPPAAPTADNATAISHEGFTARWDAVSGATSYRMDVLEGSTSIATDLFISEYLEGSSNNKYIEIFNGTGASVDLSAYSLKQYNGGATTPTYTLTFSSTPLANGSAYVIGNSSGTIYTPNLSTSSQVMQFNGNDAVALFNGANLVDVVGTIGDSSDWGKDVTLVRKATATVPNTSYSATDWDLQATNTITFLGSHTMGSAPTVVTGWNNKAVNNTVVRVGNLDPSTDYFYRVRAVNDNGTSANSNTMAVSTVAESTGEGASTSISGAEASILVPPLDGFTDNSVDVDPASTTSDDITMEVALIPTGIRYSFTGNDAALSGLYWINHAGLGFIPFTVTVNDGIIVDWTSDANVTFVEISDFGAKGTLIITLEDEEEPLPVELSSFSAILTSQNKVNVLWVTQTETNLTGFYILRADSEDLADAELISALIEPNNNSQQQTYVYSDNSLVEPGTYYYWLQVAEMDGNSALHGPTSINYTNQDTPGTPGVTLVTELKSVFPNPFNPNTTISYGIANATDVNFTIYNSRGQVVRTVSKGVQAPNNYRLTWNGTDNNGKECSTGIYYIKMSAGKDSFVRKAVLMK